MNKKIFNILFLALIIASPAYAFNQPLAFHTNNKKMLNAAQIATANAGSRSGKHCWRAVKKALFEAELVSYRPTTKYAKQAGNELQQKFYFTKLDMTNPFDAPIGSVLVYGGNGAGHVEIRTEAGFVSDFTATSPSHRPLLGVYIKI